MQASRQPSISSNLTYACRSPQMDGSRVGRAPDHGRLAADVRPRVEADCTPPQMPSESIGGRSVRPPSARAGQTQGRSPDKQGEDWVHRRPGKLMPVRAKATKARSAARSSRSQGVQSARLQTRPWTSPDRSAPAGDQVPHTNEMAAATRTLEVRPRSLPAKLSRTCMAKGAARHLACRSTSRRRTRLPSRQHVQTPAPAGRPSQSRSNGSTRSQSSQ